MAHYYIEEAWKCLKHPSTKRRNTTGVCSVCLRDRLSKLCPNCANVRPCSNCANVRLYSPKSSSSSGKIDGAECDGEAAFFKEKSVRIPFLTNCAAVSTTLSSSSGKIGDGEPAFCRSKSVGIPFLKSRNVNSGYRRNEKSTKTTSSSSSGEINSGRVGCDSEPAFFRSISRNVSSETEKSRKIASTSSSGKINGGDGEVAFFRSKSVGIPLLKSRNTNSTKTASFWWIFKSRRRGKENELEMKAKGVNDNKYYCNDTRIKEFSMTVMRSRSRSVNVAMTSVSGGNDVSDSPEKLKGWYLLSPMKVFRQSKTPKLVI